VTVVVAKVVIIFIDVVSKSENVLATVTALSFSESADTVSVPSTVLLNLSKFWINLLSTYDCAGISSHFEEQASTLWQLVLHQKRTGSYDRALLCILQPHKLIDSYRSE
jgi:hypothetical protein